MGGALRVELVSSAAPGSDPRRRNSLKDAVVPSVARRSPTSPYAPPQLTHTTTLPRPHPDPFRPAAKEKAALIALKSERNPREDVVNEDHARVARNCRGKNGALAGRRRVVQGGSVAGGVFRASTRRYSRSPLRGRRPLTPVRVPGLAASTGVQPGSVPCEGGVRGGVSTASVLLSADHQRLD